MENQTTSLGDTRDDCGVCSGSGTCDMCEGSGRITKYNSDGTIEEDKSCGHCTSPGYKAGECSYCLGTGKYDPAFFNVSPAESRFDELQSIQSTSNSEIDHFDL